ncbi:MAG: rhomboid family intramembrane serine protease [Candidatus Bathyarchaeota archaeon]|nr:rhomboid family intramembrane serine protease [Candidatus Bathyarchaeota archaeon]
MVFVLPVYDENRSSRRPYVTYGLIAVNVVVFLFFFLQGLQVQYEAIYTYGAVPADLLRGERLWTLITSMFMHSDLMHLGGNMVFLWIFGDNIEDALGHGKYLLFYFLGGFLASFAHIASTLLSGYTSLSPYFIPDLNIPSVGASGAISAILGSYLLLYPQSRIRTLVYFVYIITFASIPAYYYLGFWFLYQLLMGFGELLGAFSAVAFWAHIGGYVYGMIIVKMLNIKPRKPLSALKERPVTPIAAPLVVRPLVDILLEETRVIVLARMPGVEERDIRVGVSEGEVVISAEYRDMKFYRRVTLPVPVISRIQNLVYRNGVLSFTLQRVR